MGLEDGDFISDLDQANPITATDPVSEGSNHLRLLKKVLQQTFPGYNEAVLLTPAQLNDAAIKSQNETIDGLWLFTGLLSTGSIRMPFNSGLEFTNPGDDIRTAVTMTGAAIIAFGNDEETTRLRGLEVEFSHNQVNVANLASRANGSLLVADPAGAFSAVAKLGAEEIILAQWAVANNVQFSALDSNGDTQNIGVITATDIMRLGSGNLTVEHRAVENQLFHGSNEVARTAERVNGGLLVLDRSNQSFKQVGYRNPSSQSISASRTITQDDEARIIFIASVGVDLTVPQLSIGTTLRVLIAGGATACRLVSDAGINMRWYDGLGGSTPQGTRNLVPAGVVELYWRSITDVDIFGNGLS